MSRRAIALFAAMAVIWGIPYLLIRVAVAEVSPPVLVFVRTGIGAIVLLPIAAARVNLRPTLRRWRWVVAFALVEVAGPWVLLGWAEQQVTSSLAGLLVAGVPLVGTVIAVIVGGRDRQVGSTGLVGLLLGLVGVAAIAGTDLNASNAGAVAAIGLVVLGYATGPWILAHKLVGVPALGVMGPSLALSALIYLPFAIAQWPATPPSPGALASIVILGLVCTALAFMLFAELITAVGPVRATVITYINPAVAAILGVAVLAEPFTPAMAGGLVLVIAGSVLATRRRPSPPSEAEVPTPETATA
ncbi:MAG TPA: DMT family transporter [Candidatus Limnocylindrales bacterium]